MGMILPAVAIAGSLAQGVGSVMSANSQAGAQFYQAAVARNNAAIARQNAAYALRAGAAREQGQRMRTAGLIGQQKAAQGASGVDVNSGSAVDVRASAAELGELDALTIRNNAAREAYGYETQAQNFESQAGLDKYAGQTEQTAGWVGFGTSLLSGAANVGSKWGSIFGGGGGGGVTEIDASGGQPIPWAPGRVFQ